MSTLAEGINNETISSCIKTVEEGNHLDTSLGKQPPNRLSLLGTLKLQESRTSAS